MTLEDENWFEHFNIQSEVDLDFVIGQKLGHPIGMERRSPPEFRRRVLAAGISYQLQLASIDYTLKRYVARGMYDDDCLGDLVSDHLRHCAVTLEEELKNLHEVAGSTFGIFGAEITLYRVPYALDAARMLSNRGLMLEVLPILRLCLEMTAWAYVAFRTADEKEVVELKAQNCISLLKGSYPTVGRLYGYLSKFAHWGHVIHRTFLDINEERVAVLKASVRYRAITLALCLTIVDVFVETVRQVYAEKSDPLVLRVQGTLGRDSTRKTHQFVSKIAELTKLDELLEIQSILQ